MQVPSGFQQVSLWRLARSIESLSYRTGSQSLGRLADAIGVRAFERDTGRVARDRDSEPLNTACMKEGFHGGILKH